jgi:hypothetical protein
MEARELRAVAVGKYRGVVSSDNEIKHAKQVLSERGLYSNEAARKKKRSDGLFGGSLDNPFGF